MKQIFNIIICLFFLISKSYSQKSIENFILDKNIIAYFPLNNSLIDESKNKIIPEVYNSTARIVEGNTNKVICSYETKYVLDRFNKANCAITTTEFSIKTDDNKDLIIKDGFTTSFWFKIDYKSGHRVNLLTKGVRENQKISLCIDYQDKNDIIKFKIIQKINNKDIITGTLELSVSEIKENKWNFLVCSYDNENLNLQFNNEKITTPISHVKHNSIKNDYDFRSFYTADGKFKFLDNESQSKISFDDIIILNRGITSEEIGYLYSENLQDIKKNEPLIEFNSNENVLEFIKNKLFKKPLNVSDSLSISFMNGGKLVNFNNTMYKIRDVIILSKQLASISFYNYDVRLFTEVYVDCLKNTVRIVTSTISNEFINSVFNYSRDLHPKELENEGWKTMGISKFQLLNPNTGNWDEIMFTNPGKYIEVRNNKDLLIEDLDIFSAIVGSNKIGFYKSAKFINGTKVNAGLENTDKYEGKIELIDNNKISSNSDKAEVYFFYDSSNNLRCIQIDNYFCYCKARIFVGEYGMRFE